MDDNTRRIIANHFPAFVKYIRKGTKLAKHHIYLTEFIQGLLVGDFDRGLISMPPRHGKSFIVSEALPAFLIGNCPYGQTIMASYSQDLINKFGKSVKEIVRSDRYQQVFPGILPDDESKAAANWYSTNHHIIKCPSIGGSVTGFGAGTTDMDALIRPGLICDDTIKSQAESRSKKVISTLHGALSSDLLTRLLPNSFALIMGTRWSVVDAQGYLLSKQPDLWESLNFEAIYSGSDIDPLGRQVGEALWPEWYDVDALMRIKGTMSSSEWAAIYQGRPIAEEGNLFSVDSFINRHDNSNTLSDYSHRFLALDTASKVKESNDYTVGFVCGVVNGEVHVLDCFRERLTLPKLISKVVTLYNTYRLNTVAIESASSGIGLSQMLEDMRIPVYESSPRGSVYEKAQAVSQYLDHGKILLPSPQTYGEGVFKKVIEEFMQFPNGPHDDSIAAFNVIVNYMRLGLNIKGTPPVNQNFRSFGSLSRRSASKFNTYGL